MNAGRILLEITVYSAILFLLILLFKRVFRKQLSPSLQYFVWFLLLARLALPFTLQSATNFFVIPYGQQSTAAAQETQTPLQAQPSGIAADESNKEQAASPASTAFSEGQTMQGEPASADRTVPDPTPKATVPGEEILSSAPQALPSPPDFDLLLLLLWIGGITLVGGRTVVSYVRLARKIRRTSLLPTTEVQSIVEQNKQLLGIRRSIKVRLISSIQTPALTASLRPKLLLPVSMLNSPEKLNFAIRHELVHFRRGDYLVCCLTLVLRAVYWFNPVVWLMQKPLKTDMEAACDNIATASLEIEEKKRYAVTILELFSGHRKPQPMLGMSLPGNKKTAERRIRGIFMRHNTKRSIKFISVLVAALLFVLCFTTACQPVQEIAPGVSPSAVFQEKTIVGGVDVSGMTYEQAKSAVEPEAQKMRKQEIGYSLKNPASHASVVSDEVETAFQISASYTLDEIGATVDYESVLHEAIQNGGKPFALAYTLDDAKLTTFLENKAAAWETKPSAASLMVKKQSDEDALTTSGALDFVETVHAVEYFEADLPALKQKIKEQVASLDFVPFEVPGEMKKISADTNYNDTGTLIGSYETAFDSSSHGRRYNIWKLADLINGAQIDPGKTWSLNEIAGDRTYARGWKGAPGISQGEYQELAGGGIDQVATTLYNAALRAELDIVERERHTWPIYYAPGGLDATIATGAPDLKIRNPYDVPVYIVATCDGSDSQTIRVELYGPKFADGLTRDFSSELLETFGGGEVEYIQDSSLPAGTEEMMMGEHIGKKFQVYKHWYDADGNEVKVEKFGEVQVYDTIPAKIRAGADAS